MGRASRKGGAGVSGLRPSADSQEEEVPRYILKERERRQQREAKFLQKQKKRARQTLQDYQTKNKKGKRKASLQDVLDNVPLEQVIDEVGMKKIMKKATIHDVVSRDCSGLSDEQLQGVLDWQEAVYNETGDWYRSGRNMAEEEATIRKARRYKEKREEQRAYDLQNRPVGDLLSEINEDSDREDRGVSQLYSDTRNGGVQPREKDHARDFFMLQDPKYWEGLAQGEEKRLKELEILAERTSNPAHRIRIRYLSGKVNGRRMTYESNRDRFRRLTSKRY